MIDVHCHLNFKAFTKDYDEVIRRAVDAGVKRIINVGTSLESSEWAVELADKYPELYAIVGIHPHHADKVTRMGHPELISGSIDSGQTRMTKKIPDRVGNDDPYWINRLEQIATHQKVIAIGEIGMDFYSYKSNGIVDPAAQEEVFVKQIQLAHKLKLPLQIHNRHAGEKVIEILKTHNSLLTTPPGMFHCFAASKEVLKDALEMGFAIGFDGNVTYPGLAPGETVELSELAKLTPLERIVTETDSPYLTPIPHRGTRNEPSYGIIVGEFLAGLKGVPFDEFASQTEKNVYTLFTKLK